MIPESENPWYPNDGKGYIDCGDDENAARRIASAIVLLHDADCGERAGLAFAGEMERAADSIDLYTRPSQFLARELKSRAKDIRSAKR